MDQTTFVGNLLLVTLQDQETFQQQVIKTKMARLGFASIYEVLGAKRAGIPEPIIFTFN